MMEFALIIVALGSLTVNTLIYRELRSQNRNLVLSVEEQWPPGLTECCETQAHEEHVLTPEAQTQEAEALLSVATPPENKHQAWVNRKGIPLTEGIYIPAKPVPVPTPGPLERPGGFV